MSIPRPIANALMKYRGTPAQWSRDTIDFAEAHDVLVFVADMGGVAGMRSDGALVEIGWDDRAATEITNVRLRDLVLLSGARLYNELHPLLPQRQPQDHDCTSCGGTGKLTLEGKSLDNVVCECVGLGWIPTYWNEPNR